MLFFVSFLELIELLFHFINIVLAVSKHFSVNGFKIIDIPELEATDPVIMVAEYNGRFGCDGMYKPVQLLIDLMAPDEDLLFLSSVYDFDGNFDCTHP
ncbi:hypothetical protein PA598K_01092 [Paenibacillus sp. 598K]|nr:hypothetical protein PA598K_01092 [Paenibacillus sp. 598K]